MFKLFKSRYINGFGYRFNKLPFKEQLRKINKMSKNKMLYHLIKGYESKINTIYDNNYIIIYNDGSNPIGYYVCKTIWNTYSSFTTKVSRLNKPLYIIVINSYIFGNDHNIRDIKVMTNHEFGHVIADINKMKFNSILDEEMFADQFAVKMCGYDDVILCLEKFKKYNLLSDYSDLDKRINYLIELKNKNIKDLDIHEFGPCISRI